MAALLGTTILLSVDAAFNAIPTLPAHAPKRGCAALAGPSNALTRQCRAPAGSPHPPPYPPSPRSVGSNMGGPITYTAKLESVAASAVKSADKVGAKLMVVVTHTGEGWGNLHPPKHYQEFDRRSWLAAGCSSWARAGRVQAQQRTSRGRRDSAAARRPSPLARQPAPALRRCPSPQPSRLHANPLLLPPPHLSARPPHPPPQAPPPPWWPSTAPLCPS